MLESQPAPKTADPALGIFILKRAVWGLLALILLLAVGGILIFVVNDHARYGFFSIKVPVLFAVLALVISLVVLIRHKVMIVIAVLCGALLSISTFALLMLAAYWHQGYLADRHYKDSGLYDELNRYVSAGNAAGHNGPSHTPIDGPANATMPELVGRIVIVDMDENAFDPLTMQLPDDLFPTHPSQVGTVIQVHWLQEIDGQYVDGATAYRWRVVFCFVNLLTGEVSPHQSLLGSPPPYEKNDRDDRSGRKPINRFFEYLMRLPRKPLPDKTEAASD